jgi:hypothetical protein
MGAFILTPVLDSARLNALQRICKSFKPNVDADFVSRQLGFDSVVSGVEFFRKVGCILSASSGDGSAGKSPSVLLNDGLLIDTQKTVIDVSAVLTQDKLLL